MPRSATLRLKASTPTGSIVVVAPREIAGDELRLARLETYLQGEFPDLDFTVTQRANGGASGYVGVVTDGDGRKTMPDVQVRDVVDRVIEAVRVFLNYGERRH